MFNPNYNMNFNQNNSLNDQRITLYKTLLVKTEKELKTLKEEYTNEQQENKKLKSYNLELQKDFNKQINSVESEHKTQINKIKRKYDDQISDLESKNSELYSKYKNIKDSIERTREVFRENERSLEKRVDNLEYELNKKRKIVDECKDLLRESRNQILQLMEEVQRCQDASSELDSDSESDTESTVIIEQDNDIIDEILNHRENSTQEWTFEKIQENPDEHNVNQRIELSTEYEVCELVEEEVTEHFNEEFHKYFYTTKISENIKVVSMVDTFRWFTDQSRKYYSIINTASNKKLSSRGRCIDIVKLSTKFNNKKCNKLCLTGRGVVMLCKEIIERTGDEFKSQINDVLLIVPKLTWSLCERID